MKKLTFCVFSANDREDEDFRVTECVKSLLAQDIDQSCVIFFDCSLGEEKNQPRFGLPNHPDLTVVPRPTPTKKKWNRSLIRNEMALMVQTPIMCQVCADCIYSPGFARKVLDFMGDGNKLVCCRRRFADDGQTKAIKKHGLRSVFNSIKVDTKAALGECQGIEMKHFFALGGYYKMITEDKTIIEGSWDKTAGCDDCNLTMRIRRREDLHNLKTKVEEVWMCEDPDAWIVHLWHGTRDNRLYWEHNKFGAT